MHNYKRLLVGLDLTAMDEALIRYAAFWQKLTGAEKIYFLHVERQLYWPEEAMQALPSEGKQIDESLLATMQAKVSAVFGAQPTVDIVCAVIEGAPLAQLAQWSKVKKIDLILVGKKSILKGTGVIPNKLARASRTSILFVPEQVTDHLRRILVPTDFSDYSRESLHQALHLAQAVPGAEVFVQHVYAVPIGYYKAGYNRQEFKESLCENAQQKFKRLTENLTLKGVPLHPIYSCDEHDNLPALVCQTAVAEHIDLLVVGAKGQTALSVFLMGSVTEKLLRQPLDVPVLVVKKPNEALGFLDTVLLE